MTTNQSNQTIILDTPEAINFFQYARVISAMSIEYGTGMKLSRGGNIWILSYEMGIHDQVGAAGGRYLAKHKAAAMAEAREFCVKHGLDSLLTSVDKALASK